MSEKTTIELTKVTPKKHVVRFDTDEEDAPVTVIYVNKTWVLDVGAENGVRVTIEAIK